MAELSGSVCMKYIVGLLIGVALVNQVAGQGLCIEEPIGDSNCDGKRCGECVSQSPKCRWCYQRGFSGKRCGTKTELENANCSNITSGPSSKIEILQNFGFSNDGDGEPFQLRPQQVKMHLKPNDKVQELVISYKMAEDFPVDLYFLSDPSHTMRHYREALARIANQIAENMVNLTKNYRFGYGTAMEKNILPFSYESLQRMENPCIKNVCEPGYSFRHRMTLKQDVQEFIRKVNETITTANIDSPEGGFDGLMQAMVCEKEIGWRDKSTRLLIYSTDADYHFAGDGKLAGIIKPNDEMCHLDQTTFEYTKAEELDYPSVGQIIEKVREKKMNVIVAVAGENNLADFSTLGDLSKGITAFKLADPSSIVGIITTKYQEIRGKINFLLPVSKNLEMKMWTNCGGRVADERTSCINITRSKQIDFSLCTRLVLDKCPENPEDRKETLLLKPEGLGEEVMIDVEYKCNCMCQEEGEAVENSTECNKNGRFECGICHCYAGWTGSTCDCKLDAQENCFQYGLNGTLCSNRGRCPCGECECDDQRYTGKYCECDNAACTYTNGKLCAGHGTCNCSECVCDPGFTGEGCDCEMSTDQCQTANGTICSGHGDCDCNRCQCEAGYRGDKCQTCHTCTQVCESNKECALCVGFQTYEGDMTSEKCKSLCQHVSVANLLPEASETVGICKVVDRNNCKITFAHQVEDDGLKIIVSSKKACPPPPANITVIAISLAAGVFLILLVLLILWRLITWVYDQKEYAKFEEEIKNPRFGADENPIYKECVTKFNNPMHDSNM